MSKEELLDFYTDLQFEEMYSSQSESLFDKKYSGYDLCDEDDKNISNKKTKQV